MHPYACVCGLTFANGLFLNVRDGALTQRAKVKEIRKLLSGRRVTDKRERRRMLLGFAAIF